MQKYKGNVASRRYYKAKNRTDGGIITGTKRRKGSSIIMQVPKGQCYYAERHYNASKESAALWCE